ncbi:transposase [Streptomyces sediminimaris]|uniref:transposase n=1 Tax=Streptomyces sediminimaris TaxID=3383721 RepID=UPI00399BA23C
MVDERGERLLSRRVFNDEPALLTLIADILGLSEDALWAVDQRASRIGSRPKDRRMRSSATLAETAVEAARAQHTALSGETLAAAMVARIAKGVLALDEEIAALDALIEARFNEPRHATVIRSLPGMGALLGAEFIAATGGDFDAFGSADRLASFAGLSPVPRDSGRTRSAPVPGRGRRSRSRPRRADACAADPPRRRQHRQAYRLCGPCGDAATV